MTPPMPLTDTPLPEADWRHRLALGTVQLGMAYGISNSGGQPSRQQATAILQRAAAGGLSLLDTAANYGNSEQVIGAVCDATGLSFDIVSKAPADCPTDAVADQLRRSLDRLRVDRLYGYLAHSFTHFQDPALRDALHDARDRGLVERIGVSLYFPAEAAWLLDNDIDLDLIQLPFNLFDRRFAAVMPALRQRHIEVHARSAFLQGLFFLPDAVIAARFPTIQASIARLKRVAGEAGTPLGALLLNFALAQPDIDRVVVGVNDPAELERNLAAYRHYPALTELADRLDSFATDDERILIPYHWP